VTARIRELESELERAVQVRQASDPSLDALAPLSLEQAQAALADGHAALVWFRRGEALGVLVVRRDGASVLEPVLSAREAATLVRRQVMAVDVATRSPDTARANPSFDALVRVLRERVVPYLAKAVDVVIVPCAEVFGLPIAPALAEATDFRLTAFLAPSISSAAVIAGRTAGGSDPVVAAAGDALVVAIADASAPRMEDEARAVAACHASATMLAGAEATADAFLADLGRHDLVHVACHCEFDPQFPMASRIKLADRWVAARELFAALRPGCVVVLAGCESGRTSDTLGEDRQGLVRALLVGGASMVVASQWQLHDSAAAQLFPLLHRSFVERRSGASSPAAAMAGALSHAQRESRSLPWHSWQGLFAMGGLL
jgi:hypothetical protein